MRAGCLRMGLLTTSKVSSKFLKKTCILQSLQNQEIMTFYILNLGTFFRPLEAVFTKYRGQDLAGSAKIVPRWTSRLRQVVEFTLTNHVHFSLTCGEAGWGRA